jgi:hypothetical protein
VVLGAAPCEAFGVAAGVLGAGVVAAGVLGVAGAGVVAAGVLGVAGAGVVAAGVLGVAGVGAVVVGVPGGGAKTAAPAALGSIKPSTASTDRMAPGLDA